MTTIAPATIMALAAQCAPGVAPSTLAAVIQTESHGNQFALNVNRLVRQPARPRNMTDAVRVARSYVDQGYSVDLGLGQVNSRNMRVLGLSWENVFDPCTNMAAAAAVLSGNYQSVRLGQHPQAALRIALSMYNTGSQSRGFRNGYVGRVVGNAGTGLPAAVAVAPPVAVRAEPDARGSAGLIADLVAENITVSNQPSAASPPPPSWDVFARAKYLAARSAQQGED